MLLDHGAKNGALLHEQNSQGASPAGRMIQTDGARIMHPFVSCIVAAFCLSEEGPLVLTVRAPEGPPTFYTSAFFLSLSVRSGRRFRRFVQLKAAVLGDEYLGIIRAQGYRIKV